MLTHMSQKAQPLQGGGETVLLLLLFPPDVPTPEDVLPPPQLVRLKVISAIKSAMVAFKRFASFRLLLPQTKNHLRYADYVVAVDLAVANRFALIVKRRNIALQQVCCRRDCLAGSNGH